MNNKKLWTECFSAVTDEQRGEERWEGKQKTEVSGFMALLLIKK